MGNEMGIAIVLEYSSNPQCTPSFKLEGFSAAGKTVM